MTGLTLYRHQIITITGWVMRVSVLAGVLCLVLVSVGNADPASAAIRKSTNIPAEPLDLALKSLARERQFQVLFRAEVVRDVRTGGAVGDFTPEEAIKQLLSGTGLSYKYLERTRSPCFLRPRRQGSPLPLARIRPTPPRTTPRRREEIFPGLSRGSGGSGTNFGPFQ